MAKRSLVLARVTLVGITGATIAFSAPHDATAANPAPTPCSDATNPQSQTAACAAPNQAAFNAVYAQIAASTPATREVSPTKSVFPATTTPNGVVLPRQGIEVGYLTGNPPSANAARVQTTLNGVTFASVGNPPTVGQMAQKANGAKSRHFHSTRAIKLAKLRKSAQNIWSANEVLARAEAWKACEGKTGTALVSCAENYIRPLKGSPPNVGSPPCEGFVYNRYYGIERWMDRTSACGGDAMCETTITLDPTNGIAGKLLSGSDADPNKRKVIEAFLEIAAGTPGKVPDCSKNGLTGNDLVLCEQVKSLPPVAHVRPTYYAPIAGGGSVTKQPPTCFSLNSNSPCPPRDWYVVSKNSFYDTLPMFTPTLVAAFQSDATKYASVQRLVAELQKGQNYYGVGSGQKYPDEWAFQRHMLDANKSTSDRTFRDYFKRKHFLKQREQAFDLLFNPLAYPAPKFAIPADVVDAQLRGLGPTVFGALPSGKTVYEAPVDYQQSLSGSLPNPALSRLVVGYTDFSQQPPTAVDRFAWTSLPPKMDPSSPYPRLQCSAPDKLTAGYSADFEALSSGPGAMPYALPLTPVNGPAIDGNNPTPSRNSVNDVGTAACDYVNAVLDEWARKDMPQVLAPKDTNPAPAATGCFANDPACDWDPKDFVRGMDDLVNNQIDNVQWARREADYKFCKEWAEAPAPAGSPKGTPSYHSNDNEYTLLGEMKAKVQGAYNAMPHIPVLETGPGKNRAAWANNVKALDGDTYASFGEDRANSENWGNDLFGVGYSYDAGWELPIEWEKVDAKPDTAVCSQGAGAHGGFDAYAYAFGSDKFDILAADMAAGVNDYVDAPVPGAQSQSTIDSDMHSAGFDLDFEIAGDSLFSKEQKIPSQGYAFTPAQGANSWTLFNIPFQISFITIDISVGVGYTYEIDTSVQPIDNANACHKTKETSAGVYAKPPPPNVGIHALLDAQGELDGIVDASASLAGLAGIGVECDITLLGIGVPANAQATIGSSGLDITSSLNMDLRTLDGSLSVYAEALFFKIFDITIISWDGFHSRVPLFNTNNSAPFANLNPLGATGLTNPAHTLIGL